MKKLFFLNKTIFISKVTINLHQEKMVTFQQRVISGNNTFHGRLNFISVFISSRKCQLIIYTKEMSHLSDNTSRWCLTLIVHVLHRLNTTHSLFMNDFKNITNDSNLLSNRIHKVTIVLTAKGRKRLYIFGIF